MLGQHLSQLEALCGAQSDVTSSSQGSAGEGRDLELRRWREVDDVVSWVKCPLGLYPGQKICAHMLDLPLQERNTTLSSDNGEYIIPSLYYGHYYNFLAL